jgi:hypothetical protein
VAEENKSFCDNPDENIKSITDAKDKLKKLMSGDLSGIEGMEKAQAEMKKGFDLLAGKSIGPVEYCVCKNYIEDFVENPEYDEFTGLMKPPSSQAACEEAGGTWECKTIENFNLQDQLGKLGSLTDPNAFAAKVSEIKEQFANTYPELNEAVGKVNKSLGEFFDKIELPSLPKAGDTVEKCMCSDPLYTTQSECEAAGGTWNCEMVTLGADLSDFASTIQGGVDSVVGFFAGAVNDATSALTNANGAINFGANNTFQIPSIGDLLPEPGELVEVCVCKGGDPLASGKQECIDSGGTWECSMQPAPDLSNMFGSTGLPSFSLSDICSKVEKVEVKTVVETDPVTGKQTIVNKSDVLPEKPPVPKEEPKKPEPAPTASTAEKRTKVKAITEFQRAIVKSGLAVVKILEEKRNANTKTALKIFEANFYFGTVGWVVDILKLPEAEQKQAILLLSGANFISEEEAIKQEALYYAKYSKAYPESKKDDGVFRESFDKIHRKVYSRLKTTTYDYDAVVKMRYDTFKQKELDASSVKTDVSTTDADSTV